MTLLLSGETHGCDFATDRHRDVMLLIKTWMWDAQMWLCHREVHRCDFGITDRYGCGFITDRYGYGMSLIDT